MKRITALLHPHRIGDILHALRAAGLQRLSIVEARGLLSASRAGEQEFSVELGEPVTHQLQLDVFCEDRELADALEMIRRLGRTGQATSGWLFVSDVEQALVIGPSTST